MSDADAPSIAARKLLPEGRLAGPMPWVIAIMMFLTVLATAAGLSIGGAARAMGGALAGRVTVQIVEANPDVRTRQADAVVRELRRLTNVGDIRRLGDAEVRDLLAPWLGSDGQDTDVPVPVLIDASVQDAGAGALADLDGVVHAVAPGARVERHADWLGPLGGLLDTLIWVAGGLVALIASATAATVVLGARAALDMHRATIDVMHLIGATDRQIALLFERRVAIDAAFGAALGFALAVGVMVLVGGRFGRLGAALVEMGGLGWLDWLVIAMLPIACVGLSVLTARLTILRALAAIL